MNKKQRTEKCTQIQQYESCPNKCKNCNIELSYKHRRNAFCSKSCAASFNNLKRGKRSAMSRMKTSITLKKYFNSINLPHTKIKFCTCLICNKKYVWNSITKGSIKFCTLNCQTTFLSKCATDRLKKLTDRSCYGRGKKSYLEKSFSDWLTAHSIKFLAEVRFFNSEEKKNYFVDFYFPTLGLVIELDGTQHKKTIEQDQARDAYLQKQYGLTIVRITHSEYQKKTKLGLVCNLLGIQN